MTLKTINLRNRISLDAQQEREVKTMIILLSVFISALIFGISLTNQNKEIIADVFNNINKDSLVPDFKGGGSVTERIPYGVPS